MDSLVLAILALMAAPVVACALILVGLCMMAREVRKLQEDLASTHLINAAEWIDDGYGFYRCSGCGYEHEHPNEVTPHCPHCGANMEAEDWSDDR